MAPLAYDYLVLALGARVTFFGTEGAPEHAFPMYTLADAVRLKEHVLRRWEAADKDPSLADDGALNVVVVGGGPTGVESAGALAELYTGDFAADYSGLSLDKARITLVEAGPALLDDVQEGHPDLHQEGAGGARRRDPPRRARRVGLADPRDAQVREGAERAHAGLGRGPAGEPDRRRARPRAGEGQPGRGAARISPSKGIPRSSPSATSRGSRTRRRSESSRSWALSLSRRESARERTSRAGSPARRRSRSSTTTKARWRPSAAAPRWCSSTVDER